MAPDTKTLARDPTAAVEWQRPDDRFLPIRAADIVATLAAESDGLGLTAEQVHAVAGAFQDVIEQEAAAFERDLVDTYGLFNPDRETRPLTSLAELRTPAAYDAFNQRLCYLLDKANYDELSDVQIEAAINQANSHGLRVRIHPERVTQLSLWVRGRGIIQRPRRHLGYYLRRQTWRTWRIWEMWDELLAGEVFDLPAYRRVAVIIRLKEDPHVLIKLFKDIPEADIEALLPHAEVDMSWRDRLIVLGGGAGALGTAAGKLFAFLTGSVIALTQLLWFLLVGFGMMMFRTLMGYRRTRSTRDSQRTRHLYFQSLGNNASALQFLIGNTAEEELKEAILAYCFCCCDAAGPRTPAALDAAIEAYLSERFSVTVDFDARDAFETLTRLGLWQDRDQMRPLPPDDVVARLRQHWYDRRSSDYHQRQCTQPRRTPA
jgi:hypothetical protein